MRGTVRSALRSVQPQCLTAASTWLRPALLPCGSTFDKLPSAKGTTISGLRFKSTSKGNGGDSRSGHKLFEQQIMELDDERKDLFGSENDTASDRGRQEPFGQYLNTGNEHDEERHDDRDSRIMSVLKDSGSGHKLFEKQMIELDDERKEIFGSENKTSSDGDRQEQNLSTADEDTGNTNDEREARFLFTEKERQVWGTAGGDKPHTHSAELMQAIHAARETHFNIGSGEDEECITDGKVTDEDNVFEQDTEFTHLTAKGDSVSMVDVGSKAVTRRVAKARSVVVFPPAVINAFKMKGAKGEELVGPKGPIFATAKIAGIMGAKQTSDLIPLCHPLPLDRVNIDISLEGNTAIIECECRVTHKTGVEMEALTGASIAALTIYDMVKAVSHEVRIEGIALVSKTGGKRDVRSSTNY